MEKDNLLMNLWRIQSENYLRKNLKVRIRVSCQRDKISQNSKWRVMIYMNSFPEDPQVQEMRNTLSKTAKTVRIVPFIRTSQVGLERKVNIRSIRKIKIWWDLLTTIPLNQNSKNNHINGSTTTGWMRWVNPQKISPQILGRPNSQSQSTLNFFNHY